MPEPEHTETSVDKEWRAYLNGEHPAVVRARRIFRLLPSSPRCKLCAAPFGLPGSLLVRRFGGQPWEKNPNLCRRCVFKLSKNELGGAEVELSLLFADVRGSTRIAEEVSAAEFRALMNRFYGVSTEVLIGEDALVDKFVGDEVIGLFVPGIAGPDHARRAVSAAEHLMRATGHGAGTEPWVPIGAGVHTGRAFVGTVGTPGAVTDFTALGDTVNTTARLAATAQDGEILISDAAATAAGMDRARLVHRNMHLRGRTEAVDVLVLRAGGSQNP